MIDRYLVYLCCYLVIWILKAMSFYYNIFYFYFLTNTSNSFLFVFYSFYGRPSWPEFSLTTKFIIIVLETSPCPIFSLLSHNASPPSVTTHLFLSPTGLNIRESMVYKYYTIQKYRNRLQAQNRFVLCVHSVHLLSKLPQDHQNKKLIVTLLLFLYSLNKVPK